MQIHWVGGNLPQIGKAWMVRGAIESLIGGVLAPPIAVDTSPNSPLSQIYNPLLLKSHKPDRYFQDSGFAADELLHLAEFYNILVVKLASYTQDTFLNWLKISGILDVNIEHHFWFVTNGHRDSLHYFRQICQYDFWQIHWVRNHYGRNWQEIDEQSIKFIDICDLSGIISSPNEIDYIESHRLILKHLTSPYFSGINSLTKKRVEIFLAQSRHSFFKNWNEESKKHNTITTPPLASIAPTEIEMNDVEH